MAYAPRLMFSFDHHGMLRIDELAILLAAIGALILAVKDCVMKRNARKTTRRR